MSDYNWNKNILKLSDSLFNIEQIGGDKEDEIRELEDKVNTQTKTITELNEKLKILETTINQIITT